MRRRRAGRSRLSCSSLLITDAALQAALGVEPEDCYVVGDAVWDLLAARRAGMLSVGLLSGGYGSDELLDAGAFRVYDDTAELHASLDELGFEA
jgi:phosphoglycolate phosphatase-like HAD superfamily hydrolase